MDTQAKRKLKEIVRGLIGDGFHGTQLDLAKALKTRGFRVTQSTVSRIINGMGVTKEFVDGQQIYKLKVDFKSSYRGSLSDLVINVENNENLIVVKTRPGSAMFVAGFLDHECKSSILGTVAGDDTIFIAPAKVSKITETTKRILAALRKP